MESPWKPQCVLFIASNMALKFDTRDEATFIKILPIPFPHSFTEVDPEHPMDRELERKVLDERNGILIWVLTGMVRFWDEGLAPTAAVMAAMDGNKTANSHALQFMEAMLDAGHVSQDNMAALSGCLDLGTGYDMFRTWAEAQGIKNVPGKQTFSNDVADFYHGKKRSDGVRFIGLLMAPHFVQNVRNGMSHLSLAKTL
jgi:phage/plasmid-associated DNA primase